MKNVLIGRIQELQTVIETKANDVELKVIIQDKIGREEFDNLTTSINELKREFELERQKWHERLDKREEGQSETFEPKRKMSNELKEKLDGYERMLSQVTNMREEIVKQREELAENKAHIVAASSKIDSIQKDNNTQELKKLMNSSKQNLQKDVSKLMEEVKVSQNESVKFRDKIEKDIKDKISRLIRLETFMNESKGFIKLVSKQRGSIEKLMKESVIGYQDTMFKMDIVLKTLKSEVEAIKKLHSQDFSNLATEINNTKEPIIRVIERATHENDNIIRELERTQKNNRSLINDYLKNLSDNKNTQSQVNLFWSFPNEDLSSTYYNQRSQNTVYLPKVFSTSINGDEISIPNSDVFRNTVTSFQGYKQELKIKMKGRTRGQELRHLVSSEIKSLTRYDNEGIAKRKHEKFHRISMKDDIIASENESIKENQTLLKSEYEGDSMEFPISPVPRGLELSPKPKHELSETKKNKLQLHRFSKELINDSASKHDSKIRKMHAASLERRKLIKKHSMKNVTKMNSKLLTVVSK